MVISIKRILLVLFSTLVGVFAAINFKCALEMRIILAVAFSIVNIFFVFVYVVALERVT